MARAQKLCLHLKQWRSQHTASRSSRPMRGLSSTSSRDRNRALQKKNITILFSFYLSKQVKRFREFQNEREFLEGIKPHPHQLQCLESAALQAPSGSWAKAQLRVYWFIRIVRTENGLMWTKILHWKYFPSTKMTTSITFGSCTCQSALHNLCLFLRVLLHKVCIIRSRLWTSKNSHVQHQNIQYIMIQSFFHEHSEKNH